MLLLLQQQQKRRLLLWRSSCSCSCCCSCCWCCELWMPIARMAPSLVARRLHGASAGPPDGATQLQRAHTILAGHLNCALGCCALGSWPENLAPGPTGFEREFACNLLHWFALCGCCMRKLWPPFDVVVLRPDSAWTLYGQTASVRLGEASLSAAAPPLTWAGPQAAPTGPASLHRGRRNWPKRRNRRKRPKWRIHDQRPASESWLASRVASSSDTPHVLLPPEARHRPRAANQRCRRRTQRLLQALASPRLGAGETLDEPPI